MDENDCQICLENNNNDPFYTLPECGHSFHTNCIVQWFRSGYNNCPYCNNKGICDEELKDSHWYSISPQKLKLFYNYSRRIDSPVELKKLFEKRHNINQKNKREKEVQKIFRKRTQTDINFTELKKRIDI